ncbi:MAG: hypothetical protein CMI01_13250 [Oceanospirillaceae bacterium]|nr:hypothetical protein [Oceanospirillaceae bacterium]
MQTTDPLDALLAIRNGSYSARWNFDAVVGETVASLSSTTVGVGDAAAITYSFLSSVPSYYTTSGFSAFTALQEQATRDVLDDIEAVANVTFTEVFSGGALSFGMDAQSSGSAGYAYYPSHGYYYSSGRVTSVYQSDLGGDVWLSSNISWEADDFSPGGSGYGTLVHEVGHALGLKHSFTGDYVLSSSLDNLAYTAMSYTEHPNGLFRTVTQTGPYSYSWSYEYIQPETLMLYDIAALQYLYGANLSYRTGDDLYTFETDRPFFKTLWDAGGEDTISVANFFLACTIDLRDGYFSSIAIPSDPLPEGQVESYTDIYDGSNNLAIAYGAVIENAIGGAGDDTLVGNSYDNTFTGNGGDDTIDGGGGTDTAIYAGAMSRYTVQISGDSVTVTDSQGTEGSDQLVGIECLQFSDQVYTVSGADTPPTVESLNDIVLFDTASSDQFSDVSGQVVASDADGDVLGYSIVGGSSFQGLSTLSGDYGSLFLDQGQGTFTFSPDKEAIELLTGYVTESFALRVSDGSNTVNLSLHVQVYGGQDEAEFSGQTEGSVTEDSVLLASGVLAVADRDAGESQIRASSTNGLFGDFSINAQGQWSYTLNNATDGVQALGDGLAQTETFTVESVDGTTQSVQVRVYGSNGAVAGDVVISGQPLQGQVLMADASGLTDEEGLGALSYQWLLDGQAVPGVDQASYALSQDDVGARVSVRVSYTDGAGATESVESESFLVENVNDEPAGSVSLLGEPMPGKLLSVDAELADLDGLGDFSYQWVRDGADITGGTGSTYQLSDGDAASSISVRVSYIDGWGTPETVSSSSVVVGRVNHPPTGTVSITGQGLEGQPLTVSETLADMDGLGSFSYQWLRSGQVLAEATGSTYTPVQADVGESVSVRVSYTDQLGSDESVESASITVANVNDTPVGSVEIDGTPTQGEMLNASASLSDEDGLGELAFQWLRDGSPVGGATGSAYTLTQADVESRVSVRVSYLDGEGTQEQVKSNSTVIANINDAPVGRPVIQGSLEEDSQLSVDLSSISDDDGLGAFDYQWQRDGVLVSRTETYLLSQSDVGAEITVSVGYTDGFGQRELLVSSIVGPVSNRNDLPVGSVTLDGIVYSGEVLSASIELSDEDGLGEYSYQWLLDGVAIPGETSGTLVLAEDYVSEQVSVEVSYIDGGNTFETVTSDRRVVQPSAIVLDDDQFLWDSTIQTPQGEIVSAQEAQLYRSYYGAMGRLPDSGGYHWWLNEIEQGRHTLTSMAAGFIYSDEFRGLADQDNNGAISNEELIEHIYRGVFGRLPDSEGFGWWLSELESGNRSQSQVFIDMTQSNEYVQITANVVADMQFL